LQEISDTEFKDALLELLNIDSKDLSTVFEKIAIIASQPLNVVHSSIWVCNEATSLLECIAQCTSAEIEVDDYISCVNTPEYKAPILLDLLAEDLSNYKLFSKYISNYNLLSMLLTPLIINNEIVGVLAQSSVLNTVSWGDREISFAVSVANTISLHLEIQRSQQTQQQLNEFRKLLDVSQTIVIHWENKEDWPIKYITDNISQFGYNSEDFLNGNISYFSIICKDDIRRLIIETKKYMKENVDKFSQVYRVTTSEGIFRWVDVRVIAQRNNIGEVAGYLGTINDITYLVDKEEKVELLAKALEQTNHMVFITDKNAIITYANDSVVTQSGYSLDELIGYKTSIFKSGAHDNEFYEKLWSTVLSGKNYTNIIINKKKNGELIYNDINITPIMDANNIVQHFVVTYKDITIQMKLEEKLENLATTDSLTQVNNRYKINTDIDNYMARAKRYSEPFSILMLDIDHFKAVNDTYGHYVGDIVLKDLTRIVNQNIRDVDTFGRWGGEEFMLILDNTTKEIGVIIAEKLRHIISVTTIADHYNITVSIGVSEYFVDEHKRTLLERVDDALYEAKENGRNQVRFK
jgi:diguanylate cyclase (GGDEF)-like protein/PAS domain S-box-containing protein